MANLKNPVRIDPELVEKLERLSLVDFANVEGVHRLEEAVAFAQPIKVWKFWQSLETIRSFENKNFILTKKYPTRRLTLLE